MKIKFIKHFRASVNEHFDHTPYLEGEVADIADEAVAQAMIDAGWAVAVEAEKAPKVVSKKKTTKKKVVKVSETK